MNLTKGDKKATTLMIGVYLAVIFIALGAYAYHHYSKAPESARQLACERVAKLPKESADQAAREGISIDAAICDGTYEPVTPAQSQ